jgi:hypothetical protein
MTSVQYTINNKSKAMKNHKGLFFKMLLILAFSCLYLTSNAQTNQGRPKQRPKVSTRSYSGRDTTYRKGALTSFPLNFIASTMKVGYEFRLSPNKGLKLIGSYGASSSSTNNSNIYGTPNNTYYNLGSFSEYGLEAQLRFYILKGRPALNGLYLAPYVSYKSMNYSYNGTNYQGFAFNQNATTSDFSVGYVIGYQIIYSSSFTLDLFIGGGINNITGDNSNGTLSTDPFAYYKGIMIHPGLGIGIAF